MRWKSKKGAILHFMAYKDINKQKEANRKWYVEHREHALERQKEYEKANKEKIKETKKVYRHKPEVALDLRIRSLKRYHNNPEYRKRSLILAAVKRLEYRREILKVLGGEKCIRCGFDDYRALQVDHINGGGRKEFKENPALTRAKYYLEHIKNNLSKYQVLCSNCNWIKRHEKNEIPRYN